MCTSSVHHAVAVDTTEEQSVTAYQEDTGYEEYDDYQYAEQSETMAGQQQGEIFTQSNNQGILSNSTEGWGRIISG